MSEDEEDIIVLQVCANQRCLGIEDLEFDEESGEMYCVNCRELYARAEDEGFRLLLTDEDMPLINMIFNCFDGGKRYWTYEDFDRFRGYTGQSSETAINSHEALRDFFKEEYDIEISKGATGEYVVYKQNLEEMYGGYIYNNINALIADCDSLEDAGMIRTATLE
ncbi:hypothetical protein C3747_1g372 [Trypanosoma cruzi]|uniref:Uncharacterized protein n=1 Tax=Trypanosoma cruzi TaxID=5693 RepID=A0A2V2W1Z3_TRYCR|nr:hypothetical protein TcBrA4_0059780 [Trypanosoma cruzi]PBJ73434.1 hypothetical protein BCY84_14497 [Trypanosoma cruzi cruzi]PWV02658.1 hypothetical protein C4B63_2g334 [Trypanosoma cruzi]PWV22182.1 hypothetical protein C3747_1g372 [Trypanosoma cruzi]RNC52514.1 hypothetical protein TcCL_ESM10238 [Trypanosoma cruzi]